MGYYDNWFDYMIDQRLDEMERNGETLENIKENGGKDNE